jgi:membrane protease subunit HflK
LATLNKYFCASLILFYIIAPAEKGVILRFGAFQEETSQGPHWHLPYPIERLNRINVEAIQDMQIYFE